MKSIRARAPQASSPGVRRVMQANRSVETLPEILLGNALHKAGLRFLNHANPEPTLKCRADFVFKRSKVCVFVDGCFWHGCPKHFKTPKSNNSWWEEKISDNKKRDRVKRKNLAQHGWIIIRIWEHDITPRRLPALVNAIVKRLNP